MENGFNTASGLPQQVKQPTISERLYSSECSHDSHRSALDNHAARLRRIEIALGLDPLPQCDEAKTARPLINY